MTSSFQLCSCSLLFMATGAIVMELVNKKKMKDIDEKLYTLWTKLNSICEEQSVVEARLHFIKFSIDKQVTTFTRDVREHVVKLTEDVNHVIRIKEGRDPPNFYDDL